jgi:uncharacterized repeat protein (TIGR03833 family)
MEQDRRFLERHMPSTRGRGRERGRGRARDGDRGGRGRGWGRGGNDFRERTGISSGTVPLSSQVMPGAGVSIVLKVDQPTGHQVQGIVDEVLTSGDHPRGIKVRLVDGRVGRVQAMVSARTAREASAGLVDLGRDGENASQSSARGGRRPQFTDVRDDPYDYESNQASRSGPSLMDYVRQKPVRTRKGRQSTIGANDEAVEESSVQQGVTASELVKCPVCNEFEGDEGAVAHHVNSHFD